MFTLVKAVGVATYSTLERQCEALLYYLYATIIHADPLSLTAEQIQITAVTSLSLSTVVVIGSVILQRTNNQGATLLSPYVYPVSKVLV